MTKFFAGVNQPAYAPLKKKKAQGWENVQGAMVRNMLGWPVKNSLTPQALGAIVSNTVLPVIHQS